MCYCAVVPRIEQHERSHETSSKTICGKSFFLDISFQPFFLVSHQYRPFLPLQFLTFPFVSFPVFSSEQWHPVLLELGNRPRSIMVSNETNFCCYSRKYRNRKRRSGSHSFLVSTAMISTRFTIAKCNAIITSTFSQFITRKWIRRTAVPLSY